MEPVVGGRGQLRERTKTYNPLAVQTDPATGGDEIITLDTFYLTISYLHRHKAQIVNYENNFSLGIETLFSEELKYVRFSCSARRGLIVKYENASKALTELFSSFTIAEDVK